LYFYVCSRGMDSDQLKKWQKVKEELEKANKIDSPFYKRAVVIVTTGVDPGSFLD